MSQDGSELLDTEIETSGEVEIGGSGGEAPETTGADLGNADTSGDTSAVSSPPRDKAGRFTKAEAKRDLLSTAPDSGDEPTEAVADATAAGTTETTDERATAVASESEGAEGAPASTPEKPVYEKEPWSVMSDKEAHQIEGAIRVKGHGVLIPEASLAQAERLLSRGLRYEKQWRELRELQESMKAQASAPSAETTEAKALLAELKPLLQDAATFAEFMEDPQGNLDRLLMRVERAVLTAENERLKTGLQTGREQVEQIDTEEQMATEFRSAFDRIATHEFFKGKLPQDELQAAYAKLSRYHQRFFRNAETDMPEYGVKAGDRILEQQVIVDELADRLKLVERAAQEKEAARKEAEKVAEAARRNQAAINAAKPGAKKAAVPVARSSTGTSATTQARKLTAREAKRELMDEEYES